jgi:parvulin-like peptidyl-prolyl isomerase
VRDLSTKPRYRALENTREPVSRRTIVSRVVLGVVSVALIAGMVIQFTPNLGAGLGGAAANEGKTLFTVNGIKVTERELDRYRQQNPLFQQSFTGTVGQDIENSLAAQVILIKAAQSDSARIRIPDSEVAQQLAAFRAQNGLQKDADFLARIQSVGYTDASFRDTLRLQTQIQKRLKEIQDGVTVSDAELKLYYDLNKANYRSEERVLARQIVVNDAKTAAEVQTKIKAGEDFVALVKQYSKDEGTKVQDGALGAKTGEKNPGEVTALALPTNVAGEVFKLKNGGVTSSIADGGKFYIIKVEKYLPAGQQTFEEAKTKLTEDAKQTKSNGAIENWIRTLEKNAVVVPEPGSNFSYFNPPVLKVGDRTVTLTELNRQVYNNQQIQQFLAQGGAQGATLVEQFFKPQTLENITKQAVAVQAAKKTGQPFIGADIDVSTAVQQWETRDVTVSDAEVRAYYDKNLSFYTTPASANINEATFPTLEAAKAFRAAFLAAPTSDFNKEAAKQKGTVTELGSVTPDSIDPAFKTVIFQARALTRAGAIQISDVIQKNKQFVVLGVTTLINQSVKPFADAREDAAQKALAAKRSEEGAKWLTAAQKDIKVQNLYADVRKQLEARAAKAEADKKAAEAKAQAEAAAAKKAEADKNPPLEVTVSDPSAKVTVRDGTKDVETATGGKVSFKLPNGLYTLIVEAKGFKTYTKEFRFPDEKMLDVKLEAQK